MADGPTLTEILISQLGTPQEPLGISDYLVIGALLAAAAAYFFLEYKLGCLLTRLARPKTRGKKPPGGS